MTTKLEFNDEGYKAFIHSGGDAELFSGDNFNRRVMLNFINRLDSTKPLKQTIRSIVRIQAPIYDTKTGDETGEGEFVYYVIGYESRDRWGARIASPEIIEGKYTLPRNETVVRWTVEDNQPKEHVTTEPLDTVTIYTIPFEGKKTINSILKKHNNESRKDKIVYTVFTGKGRDRCDQYSYEQFTESDFQHCRYLANRIGGPKGDFSLSKMDPAKANLTCNCPACQKVNK